MVWVVAAIVVVALGVAAVAATGGFGEMAREPVRDVYRQALPDTPLTGAELAGLRFGVTLRGYSMTQVDEVLDRLAREIGERDAAITDLQWALDGERPRRGEPVEAVSGIEPSRVETLDHDPDQE